MYENFDKFDKNLKQEEHERKGDIRRAGKRDDDLLEQIEGLKRYNENKTKSDNNKGQEDLQEEKYLNTLKNFSQTNTKWPEPSYE